MNAIIVGYGSIGKRHARLLKPLVPEVSVVSAQPIAEFPVYATLAEAVQQTAPGYVVLCSATHLHGAQLRELKRLGFSGKVLVEKPLVSDISELEATYPFQLFVGYNLRFHPVIQALQELLQNETVLSVNAYVGQHLAQWRPRRAPRDTYSAHKVQGGGVLRDLSHELDLLGHLFGPLELQAAMVERVGDVTVDSEDVAALLLRTKNCPVISLQMNYLDHRPQRYLNVITRERSVTADFISGAITQADTSTVIHFTADDSYLAMHRAVLAGENAALCTLEQGRRIVQLIAEAGA